MRLLPVLLVSMLLGFQVHAQQAPPPVPPGDSAPARHVVKKHVHRMTAHERFAEANTTHDGHLTLEQAKAHDRSVARHFADIDTGKKGYVTEEDITAWHKMERAAHHRARSNAKNTLRARPVMHRTTLDSRTMTPTHDGMASDPANGSGGVPPVTDKTAAARTPGA